MLITTLYGALNIFLIDSSFYLITKLFKLVYNGKIETAKWFYVHSIMNAIVMYYASKDIQLMIKNFNWIPHLKWTENTEIVFTYSTLLHIYHSIFFTITKNDLFHHLLMVFICAPLTYMTNSIITSFALFFLSGFPGFIDYMLLYFVKLNLIDSLTEKYIYIYLTTWIRNPGCAMCVILAVYILKNIYDKIRIFCLILSTIITFFNGNYYLMVTYFDYFSKLEKLKENINNQSSQSNKIEINKQV